MTLDHVSTKKAFENLDINKQFHVYRYLWRKSGAYEILTDYPLHLDMELSGKCNFQCEDCFQNGMIEGELGLMDPALFKDIIREGVQNGLCAVKLQIRGESFLHPDIFDLIRFAKNSGVLDVQITTNGSLLNKEKIHHLLESGIDAVIFSVDSHHQNNFKETKAESYQKKTENLINYLLERRKEDNRGKPWVRIRSSIANADIDTSGQVKTYLKNTFPLADIYIVGRLHNFSDSEDSYPDLHVNYRLDKCAYLTQRLAVFWNGDVTTCCMDYNGRFELGNVKKMSMKDIWLSEKMNHLRRRHLQGKRDTVPICRHCHACITPVNQKIYHDTQKRHKADLQSAC